MDGFASIGFAWTAFQAVPGLWAYLDPGMGSMVLQVLLAGLLSSAFFIKTWVRQVRCALSSVARKS